MSTLNLKVYEEPPLICHPLVPLPKFQVLVQVSAPVHCEDVEEVTPEVFITELPFESRSSTPPKKVEIEGAVPLNVTVIEFKATVPALSAVKVRVPRSSGLVFERPDALPKVAAANVSLERNTVNSLPVGEERDIEELLFDVEPNATIDSCKVSFAVSVEVAILKECVVLSEAAEEL